MEKLDKGDALEISVALKDILSHFVFKKDFLFHLLFRDDLSGFWLCVESFSADNKEFFSVNAR